MPAVSVANRRDTYAGDLRVVRADLSSIDNNDTWDTGMQTIEGSTFTPTTAAATTQMGATVAGGVITFKVESGTLAAMAMVWGT